MEFQRCKKTQHLMLGNLKKFILTWMYPRNVGSTMVHIKPLRCNNQRHLPWHQGWYPGVEDIGVKCL